MERRNSFSKNCLHCHSRISFKQKINKFCSSKCAATFNQKEGGHRKWTDEDKNKQSYLLKNKPIPSNRKIYDTVIRKCPICSSDFSIKEYSKKECCSRICSYKHIKQTGKFKGKMGGFRLKGGRAKTGWYKGVFCGSTYELAWVITNLDNNVDFKRNLIGFPYTNSKGERRKYYPDFYLPLEDCYVEIKGYREKEFNNKQCSFPHKIKIIEKDEIKSIVSSVKEKYFTKNLQDLYEKNC